MGVNIQTVSQQHSVHSVQKNNNQLYEELMIETLYEEFPSEYGCSIHL